MGDVLVVAEHLDGALSEITFEMLGAGKALAGSLGGACTAVLVGGSQEMAGQLGAAEKLFTVETDGNFNPEIDAAAVQAVVEASNPQVVLVGSTSMGMDVANRLAMKTGRPHIAYCARLEGGGGGLHATSQLYGGKMNADCELGADPCVVSLLPGVCSQDEGKAEGQPNLEAMAPPSTPGKVRFKQLILPEAADVDITTQEVLVAIGRGIGKKEDIEVAEELAEKLNAAVAASRPIIDAGWLPRSRQVGKSGVKVQPKVYLALGISGAPEHIEGMKSSATIIAVNTDKNAPIFDVAHYGLVGDLFDVCEEITDEL